jgi:hypothetical protein
MPSVGVSRAFGRHRAQKPAKTAAKTHGSAAGPLVKSIAPSVRPTTTPSTRARVREPGRTIASKSTSVTTWARKLWRGSISALLPDGWM